MQFGEKGNISMQSPICNINNRTKIFLSGCSILFNILLYFSVAAQNRENITIKGVVFDKETKEMLIGASIRISNTSKGTLSDGSGRFGLELSSVENKDSLIVTFIGYGRYTILLSHLENQSSLEIAMTKQTTFLKEVVVHSRFWLKRYTPKELNEDYAKFYTIMENVHTGLFEYLPEKDWQALKDSSLQLCKYPMTHSEFYRLIALHVGKIRNAHTRHGVTDRWYRKKQNIFPFNVKYLDDKLYIYESLVSDLSFPKGCEITMINGWTPLQIRDMIWPYIPADGYNQTSKTAELNDYFPWFFSLFVEEAGSYEIRLKTLTGDETIISTPGLRDSFNRLSLQQLSKWKKTALELQIDDILKTAYFRIEDSRVFKDSLKTYFQRIHKRGVQNLIIDLRGKGGIREEEQVAELYAYLVIEPFYIYDRIEVRSNDHTIFDKDFTYKPYARSLKEIKEKYFSKLIDSGQGHYLWQGESYMKETRPARTSFTGKVYILVDGRNYSASTDFTSLASQLDNVTVIGEETGGEYRSYISGAIFRLKLPNSKIGIKVPTWKTVTAIEEDPSNRGRGVFPDYTVPVMLDDFIKGNDVVKDFAYKLIADKN